MNEDARLPFDAVQDSRVSMSCHDVDQTFPMLQETGTPGYDYAVSPYERFGMPGSPYF
jgi:hypothetical protein